MPGFNEITPTPYDSIAVTAINTAMLMSYSGIQYFPEIAEVSQDVWQAGRHDIQPSLIDPAINAADIELRYRQASRQLLKASQIIDIAAGLTPRGATMARDNPALTYVEFDLPITSHLKRSVLSRLIANNLMPPLPANLHFLTGSALEPRDFAPIAGYINLTKPVHITSEGLLHYMTHPEKAAIASSISALISTNPSSRWYTDMPVWEGVTERHSTMAKTTSQQSGRSVQANRFQTPAEAEAFFTGYNLAVVARHSYVEPTLLDSLSSPARTGATRDAIVAKNKPWSLWELRHSA